MQIYRKNSFFRNFGPLVGAEDIKIFENFLDIFGAHTNGQLLVAITYQNSEKSIFRSTLLFIPRPKLLNDRLCLVTAIFLIMAAACLYGRVRDLNAQSTADWTNIVSRPRISKYTHAPNT